MTQGLGVAEVVAGRRAIDAALPYVTGSIYRPPSSPSVRSEDGRLSIACVSGDEPAVSDERIDDIPPAGPGTRRTKITETEPTTVVLEER